MIPEKTTTIEAVGSEYVMTEANGKQSKVTSQMLASSVELFLQDAARQYGYADVYEYLLPHLEAEIAEAEGKRFDAFIREDPLKFYKTIRLLGDKRIFKGKCRFCSDL